MHRSAATNPLHALTVVALCLAAQGAYAGTLEVCSGCAYTTVAGAIAAAEEGDTVLVGAGVYREGPLVIDKTITVQGEGWPVLDGELEHQILTVAADRVVVRGLVLRDAGGNGRIREIAIDRLAVSGPVEHDGKRLFRLERR